MRVCATLVRVVAVVSLGSALLPMTRSWGQAVPRISFARPEWTSAESFSDLSSVRELSNGTVLVADQQEAQVHLISTQGKTLSAIGRKGSGPGEYQYPARLIALASDSTLLVDRDARRFLLIDGRGKVVATHPFPNMLAGGAELVFAADVAGRLYFRVSITDKSTGTASDAGIGRWQRGSARFDTVAVLAPEPRKVEPIKIDESKGAKLAGQLRVRFAAVDDWAVAPNGRIAIIHATPYRVDWLEKNGTTTMGTAVAYTPVPVTDQDKKLYEPKGPPFVRPYATVKSPFLSEMAVVDDADNVWIPRFESAGAASRRWDVFGSTGKHLGNVSLSSDRKLLAVTKRFAYVAHTDTDGLKWLERYAR